MRDGSEKLDNLGDNQHDVLFVRRLPVACKIHGIGEPVENFDFGQCGNGSEVHVNEDINNVAECGVTSPSVECRP